MKSVSLLVILRATDISRRITNTGTMILFTEKITYEGKSRIRIIPKTFIPELAKKLKQIPGTFWKPKIGWMMPATRQAQFKLAELFGADRIKPLSEEKTPKEESVTRQKPYTEAQETAVLRLTEQLMLNRYSHSTVKTYRSFFRQFLAYFPESDPLEIGKEDIRNYMLRQMKERKWSESAQNQAINAIKFYYEKVLGRERELYDLRPRKSKILARSTQRRRSETAFRISQKP